jgi:hypothetical protein
VEKKPFLYADCDIGVSMGMGIGPTREWQVCLSIAGKMIRNKMGEERGIQYSWPGSVHNISLLLIPGLVSSVTFSAAMDVCQEKRRGNVRAFLIIPALEDPTPRISVFDGDLDPHVIVIMAALKCARRRHFCTGGARTFLVVALISPSTILVGSSPVAFATHLVVCSAVSITTRKVCPCATSPKAK